MRSQKFVDPASDASAFEVTAISRSVVHDVYDVLAAAEPAATELSPLAARAIGCLDVALREAAGSPTDARWRAAYDALAAFLDCYARRSRVTSNPDSFDRLSDFLAENADLVPGSTEAALRYPRALEHAHGW